MTHEEKKAELRRAHEARMAELRRVHEALMGSDPSEALRRVREGKYLPKKSPTSK